MVSTFAESIFNTLDADNKFKTGHFYNIKLIFSNI